MIKKILLFLFSLLVGIILFVWILQTVGWQEIKNAFLVFTGWQGATILFLTFLMALVGTWKWKRILDETDYKVPFKEVWRVYLASFSIRFLAPVIIVGAEIFQGYILRKKNSVPWSEGMASVIIDRVLEWTTNLIVVFFGAIFFLFIIGLPPLNLIIIFGSIFLVFLVGVSFFYFKAFKRESIAKAFVKIFNQKINVQPFEVEKEIFNFFKFSRKKIVCKVFALNFLRAGIMFLRTWLLIFFLGEKIGALPTLSVLSFSYLAVMFPIPTALGSHEIIQTFAFGSLGLGIGAATAFTMIIRGAELIIALLGVIFLFRLGVFLIKDIFFKKIKSFTN